MGSRKGPRAIDPCSQRLVAPGATARHDRRQRRRGDIRGTSCRAIAARIDFERASAAAPDGLALPSVNRFEDLRVLPVRVWVDAEHIRRVRFTNGRRKPTRS